MRRIAAVALTLLTACAARSGAPGGGSGEAPRAPYLHPTARLVFPEEILGMRAFEIHEFAPRDIAANYQGSGVLLTVYIYPADALPDPSLESHFREALAAIAYRWGIDTAKRLDLALDGDPRGPALAALFEVDRDPRVFGALAVFQACSHIVKFRLSSGPAVSAEQRLAVLDAALATVLPKDFVSKALESFGSGSCAVEVEETADASHASADGCRVFWNPASGVRGLHEAMCAALDAKVAAAPPAP